MKRSIIALLSIVAGFGLCAQDAKSSSPLVVGLLKGPTGVGLARLADSQGAPAPDPAASYRIVPSVDIMLSKITTGEVDIAALPANTAAKLYNGGLGYALLAVIGNGMLSYVTADPGLTEVRALAGRKIFVSGQGSVPEYVFRMILSKNGLDPDASLSLDFTLAYPEAVAALVAGKIRDAVLPEPFATMALSGNPALRVPFDIQALYAASGGTADYPISVLVVKKETAAKRPDAVKVFLAAARESIAWTVANPADAGKIVERLEFGMKATVAEASIPKANYVFKTARDSKAEIETLFGILLRQNPASIGGKLPDAGFYAF